MFEFCHIDQVGSAIIKTVTIAMVTDHAGGSVCNKPVHGDIKTMAVVLAIDTRVP